MIIEKKRIRRYTPILIIIFILSSKIPQIFYTAHTAVRSFFSAQCSYDQLRSNDSIFYAISEAKYILPKNARVNVSPINWDFNRVKARYALYPFKLSEDWDFFIDLDGTFKDAPQSYKKHQLISGVTIFARPDSDFVHQTFEAPSYHLLSVIIIFLSIHTFFVFFGAGILALFKIAEKDNGMLWYLSTSYIFGFLASTIVVWLFLITGFDLNQTNIVLFWLTAFFLLFSFRIGWFLKSWRKSLNTTTFNLSLFKRIDTLSLTLFVILIILSLVIAACLTPVASWDAMANWIMKSKIIFHEKKLIFDYTHHNEYPILWPLNIAIQFSLLGGYYDEVAKWTTALLIIAFTSQLAAALTFIRIKYKWICILVLLYFACFFHRYLTYALAETPFLVFFTGCLTAMIAWLENEFRTKYLLLLIIMAIGLTLVKFEGGVACSILGISLLISCRNQLSLNKAGIAVMCLFLVPVLEFGWIIWNKSAGYLPTISHLSDGLSIKKTILVIRQAIVLANNSDTGYGLFAGLFVFTLLKSSRNFSVIEETLFVISIAMIMFCAIAVMGWNIEDINLIGTGTTFGRLFRHVTPALLILLGSLIFKFKKD